MSNSESSTCIFRLSRSHKRYHIQHHMMRNAFSLSSGYGTGTIVGLQGKVGAGEEIPPTQVPVLCTPVLNPSLYDFHRPLLDIPLSLLTVAEVMVNRYFKTFFLFWGTSLSPSNVCDITPLPRASARYLSDLELEPDKIKTPITR